MTELHEVSFKWPAGPSKVVVTGSFDHWSHTTELSKGPNGFTGTFHVPWDAKVTYKYVVDGKWETDLTAPQEPDEAGNINNVYTSPPKPAVVPQGHKESSPVAPVAAVAAVVAPSAPAAEKTSMEGAKDTAASVVSYMASGLGAAFASVTGIDPINPQQIPLDDEKAKEVLETIPVSAPDAKKAEPAPIIGTAHDPLVPEAPIAAKPISDALAPIVDEPVVLNLLPATSSTITNTTTTVTEQVTATSTSAFAAATSYIPSTAQLSAAVSSAVAAVTDKLPSTSTVVDKAQEVIAPATSVPIPDAPEPYKEAPTTDPIPIPDAPEPYKVTANGTLPGEVEAAPTKVEETVEKVKEETVNGAVPTKATEAAEKVKDAVGGVTDTVKGTVKSIGTGKSTPPASPTKRGFPSSDTAGSITSSSAPGDGTMTTPKRKKRRSIFGKLKEALTPDKKKKERHESTSS